ncbi:tRNA (adenine-N1)-methyltransferase [bacterium]|nr:tRNA (adenine-N1)-methyltransferase [bacterium]
MTSTLRRESQHTEIGDLVHLFGEKDTHFIFPLKEGAVFQTHLGMIPHETIAGIPWGSQVQTHRGNTFILLQPQLDDLLRVIARQTQIMYPKDIGYVLVTMGVGPGSLVLEAGTGSGALTTALAYMVGDNGRVISYERNASFSQTAQENLARFGLNHRVTFKCQDLADGIEEEGIHSVFLDLPNPEDYIHLVRPALIPGGTLGCLLPTTNQVSTLIKALKQHHFGNIEISEIMHRYYKPSATRLRPEDRMVAHTGFLIFTRKIALESETTQPNPEP